MISLSADDLETACGGFHIPWRKIGEYAAPSLLANPITMPLGIRLANKGAAVHGAAWAAGGAVAGSGGGGVGAGLGALGGGLAGYHGALLGRDVPTK